LIGDALVICIHFLHFWLAYRVTEKTQKNVRCHEAHGRFWLLCKGNNDETHTLKQCTSNCFSW